MWFYEFLPIVRSENETEYKNEAQRIETAIRRAIMEARVSIIKMFGKKTAKRPVNSDMDKQRKYEALVRAYHRDLFRNDYWLCKDKSIAEDLVQ